jgi:hypothetical protein
MNKPHKLVSLFIVLFITVGAVTPAVFNGNVVTTYTPIDTGLISATNYQVTVNTFNQLMAFNDDDFQFIVKNGTLPLNNAWVRLYDNTTMALEYQGFTDGNGKLNISNVAPGGYIWNVSHPLAVDTPDASGTLVSNGPEAYVNYVFGNVDWQNDEDDFEVTVRDIQGRLAYNLNLSILFESNGTLYEQAEVLDGKAAFWDLPNGFYEWELRVLYDPVYAGYLLASGTLEANGTQQLALNHIGPITGDPDYYDLEVFTYYETSLIPIVGAIVEVTFKNGTIIDTKVTPANGSVIFIDLPVAFINWSITYLGQPVGLGSYYRDLTDVSSDILPPVIVSPGDKEYLLWDENVTITWHVEDRYPDTLQVLVDGEENMSISWVNSTYDFVYNVSYYFGELEIGNYEVTLVATDQNSNTAQDTITVRIYENVTPVIEGPGPVEFYFTETGETLSWNITDDYPDMYTVTNNGSLFASGDIDPDEPIVTIGLSGLAVGVHNFTIQVNDTSGNTASHSVLVTVIGDTTPPVIVFEPSDVRYAQGDINIVRNWTVTDESKDFYVVTVDGAVIVNASWTSETIAFDFSGLSAGTHEVVLSVTDLGGNTVVSTVMVYVSMPTVERYLLAIAIGAAVLIGLAAIVWYIRFR